MIRFLFVLFWVNFCLSACVCCADYGMCLHVCTIVGIFHISTEACVQCMSIRSVRVFVCCNNGAWWTGASFDAMKADRRETGPIRRVGAAN